MIKKFPISKTELQVIERHAQQVQAARASFDTAYSIMLARYDLPEFRVLGVTETELTVEVPDEPAGPVPAVPKPAPKPPPKGARK